MPSDLPQVMSEGDAVSGLDHVATTAIAAAKRKDTPWVSPRLSPIPMPEPKVQSSSYFDPRRIAMPHSPRDPPSVFTQASPHSQAVDILSPGSTNNQGVFIGGFVKPARQTSANTPEGPVFPVPQIPKFPYSVDNNALIDNGSGVSDYQIGRPSGQVLPVKAATPIGTDTSVSGVLAQLCSHGCQDLSNSLDRSAISARPVSRGGFGEVYSGKLSNGTSIALKVITIPEHYDDPKHLKHAARELHTWSKCKHPNVVPLLGLAEFDNRIAMVSCWLENGDLRKYVNRNPAADRLSLCIQTAKGLEYLHLSGIVHGDLKGPNVLVSGDGIPVLIDFGNATLSESTLQFTQTVTKHDITPRWAAPELLRNAKPSTESDVYALGMTVLETLTGDVPYAGVRDNAILYTIGKLMELPDRPKKHIPGTPWGDTLWLLLTECWEGDPGIRPKATDVRQRLEKIFEERQRR
ncbi:Serine/threonine-protein kinase [Ceratobasidium sp. AG-Ba]|nr:Serine/threonine-protein kinase [Ceratobasidium sp. AG-Ba]QRW03589.1 Serine/threonine-protein kinase [Ceratobasidium sp. AG-Ba]